MRRSRLPMNVQFFADAAGAAEMDGKNGEPEKEKVSEDEQGVAEQTEKAGDDTGSGGEGHDKKEDIAALVQEEIKKASMNPEEKAAYEKQKKEKELADREDAISLRERQADAKELLTDNGLPVEFRDMVMGKDKEETQKNVRSFKEKFDAAVQAQVEQRLKGKTPVSGTGYTGSSERQTLQTQVESYL